MRPILKIKVKLFLFNFLFELIMASSITICAIFNKKYIETLLFYICWFAFRFIFPKIYHYRQSSSAIKNVLGCLFWSSAIFWIAIPHILPISISIFSSVCLGILINYILYKIQDYVDLKRNSVNHIYNMDEDCLRNYAKSKGLSEVIIDTLVLRVVYNYRWVDIEKERNYSKEGIRYHKEKLRKTFGIKI